MNRTRHPTPREVVRQALSHRSPAWVPWQFHFTQDMAVKLRGHYGSGADLDVAVGNHLLWLGQVESFTDLGGDRVRDRWGVVWNRSVDRDIGVIEGQVLPEPDLAALRLPDLDDPGIWAGIEDAIAARSGCFRVFQIGFSLYERAWTLRGMEALMTDMIEHPDFVESLLDVLCDWNIALARRAMARYDLDAVYFGDDWGSQRGLQMGPRLWRRLIAPRIRRMYTAVRTGSCFQLIHSCGDVAELFPDLIEAGLSCFNPFQPEVMDVPALFARYRGRLAFNGGLSTQRLLPQGTPEEVAAETDRLIAMGQEGGYILSPAHTVQGDVPVANLLAAISRVQAQPGWLASRPGLAAAI